MEGSYLLDTDAFSYAVSGRSDQMRQQLGASAGKLALSAISLAELRYGVQKKGSRRLASLVDLFLELVSVVDFDSLAAENYAGIRTQLERAGTPIGANDMLIAAVALSKGYTLVTNNTSHFGRIKGLKLVNWAEDLNVRQ